MEPLKQWICDVCGEIIEKPEDGYVVWGTDQEDKLDKMLILHKNNRHKDGTKTGCDREKMKYTSLLPLSSFLGDDGKVLFLSLVDAGPYHCPEYKNNVADVRLLLEVYRRLQIPYYEEARLYWDRAMEDGYFQEANEVWMYLPETLRRLIELYKK